MIIGVTGTNGAGKGTVVDYLVQKGFHHYSVRTELIEEIKRRGLAVDRPNMRIVANDLRQGSVPEYFDQLFFADAKEKGYQNFLIESVRVVKSAEWLKDHGAILMAVDADRHVRYERSVLRGSETDKIDFATWVAQEEREWNNEAAYDMNVPAVIQMADYTLTNNGTPEELHKQIDEVLAKLK